MYSEASPSVRAGIEPLTGLNVSWPSFEPASFSHSRAASRCGAPTGRVKLSERKLKMPSVPGDVVALYSVSQSSSFSMRK